MLSKRIRLKLLLLLVLAASAVGVGTGSTSAQCGYVQCRSISQGGQQIGYGCVEGAAFAVCQASVNSCFLSPCA